VLTPGQGLGAGAKRQAVQPATLQAPAAPDLGTTTRVSLASDGSQGKEGSESSSISADGRYVAFTSLAGNVSWIDAGRLWSVITPQRESGDGLSWSIF